MRKGRGAFDTKSFGGLGNAFSYVWHWVIAFNRRSQDRRNQTWDKQLLFEGLPTLMLNQRSVPIF
jgi:hypothetical protein